MTDETEELIEETENTENTENTEVEEQPTNQVLSSTKISASRIDGLQDMSNYVTLNGVQTIINKTIDASKNTIVGISVDYDNIQNKPTFSNVSYTGSYNDLIDKPSISSEVTEQTVSDWGFTKNKGTVTTVNNTNPDNNGNVTITIPDSLPDQTGNSGKFLTTNGTTASWETVDALPSQSGNNGKFLTTNGTSASWETITVPDIRVESSKPSTMVSGVFYFITE